ncbi:MAG: thioredoxin family protein [Bacteroidia bacterium]
MNIQINKARSFNFNEYLTFLTKQVVNGINTTTLSEEQKKAIPLNLVRMKRISDRVTIIPELKNIVSSIKEHWQWIILTESWCGDGAQNIPIIAKIVQLSDKITLKIILRDENLDLMDGHLTEATRSIPKLICINTKTNEETGSWGPRPRLIQEQIDEMKKKNLSITHDDLVYYIHLCYAKDRNNTLQSEFVDLISNWINKA